MVRIVSLFDGLGGAYAACQHANVDVTEYFTSEIDIYSSAVARYNFPNIKELGDIEYISDATIDMLKERKIDLLIGGSPCQDLTQAKANRKGLEGERSKLFFQFLRFKEKVGAKYFLLENVGSMSQENRDLMSKYIGVQPVVFNSRFLVPQNRKRYYWTNIPHPTIEDQSPRLAQVLETANNKDYYKRYHLSKTHYDAILKNYRWKETNPDGVCGTLMASYYKKPPYGPYIPYADSDSGYRMLTPRECERLQGLPDDFTLTGHFHKNVMTKKQGIKQREMIIVEKTVSDTQRYKMLGNGFTTPVIAAFIKMI